MEVLTLETLRLRKGAIQGPFTFPLYYLQMNLLRTGPCFPQFSPFTNGFFFPMSVEGLLKSFLLCYPFEKKKKTCKIAYI